VIDLCPSSPKPYWQKANQKRSKERAAFNAKKVAGETAAVVDYTNQVYKNMMTQFCDNGLNNRILLFWGPYSTQSHPSKHRSLLCSSPKYKDAHHQSGS
jgi:hypothetical protein